jgi:hypothetical protein
MIAACRSGASHGRACIAAQEGAAAAARDARMATYRKAF